MDREARKLWLNEDGPSVHMAEAMNMHGSNRPVPTVRKEKKLVRNVLWPEPRSLWAGLGGQRLPERQGQPRAKRDLPRA